MDSRRSMGTPRKTDFAMVGLVGGLRDRGKDSYDFRKYFMEDFKTSERLPARTGWGTFFVDRWASLR